MREGLLFEVFLLFFWIWFFLILKRDFQKEEDKFFKKRNKILRIFIPEESLSFQDFQEVERIRKNMQEMGRRLKRIIWLPLTTGILFVVLPLLEIAIGIIIIILDIAFAKNIVLDKMKRSLEGIEKDYSYMKTSIHELLFGGEL